MERRDRNWLAGVAGVTAGLMLLVILLILLLPAPASGPVPNPKPPASPTPKPTSKPTSTTTLPTATAGPHGGNGGGGIVQPTATGEGQNGTPAAEATHTPSPTLTPPAAGHDGVTVYFNQSTYSVEGAETFWTGVMIGEADCFWGAQFDIEYDHSLIEARPSAARRGSLYDANTGNWTEADFNSVSRQGSGPNEEGRIRIQVDWRSYPSSHGSTGMNTSGGTLIHLKWRTTTSTGVTDVNFVEFKALVGYGPPPDIEWEIAPVLWTNSSVSVH